MGNLYFSYRKMQGYTMVYVCLLLFCIMGHVLCQSPCEIKREKETHESLIGVYVPQCESNGDYSPMQCHVSTGYCWCVDDNGVQIGGLAVQPWIESLNCGK